MRDYFDFDIEDVPDNDDTWERFEHRSRFSLKEILDYDRDFINRILNREKLTEADRYNVTRVIAEHFFHYLDSTMTLKGFEEFLIEVNGREWHDSMMKAWLRRKGAEMARNTGCPEFMPEGGAFFYDPDGEE